MSSSNVNFSPLSQNEIYKKMNYLLDKDIHLFIWKKGRKSREEVKLITIDDENQRIKIKRVDEKKSSFVKKDILITFTIKGLQFFGKGKVQHDSTLKNDFIELSSEFYKCERRKSYRLMTFPQHEALLVINLDENYQEPQKGQILDFNRTLADSTDLFKNFLALVNDGEIVTDEKKLVFRVHDVSTGGLAIVIGAMEKRYFEVGKELTNILLNFNGEDVEIKRCKIVYSIPHKDTKKSDVEQFKVGFNYVNLSEKVDLRLSKLIQINLREEDFKKSFEDFLK